MNLEYKFEDNTAETEAAYRRAIAISDELDALFRKLDHAEPTQANRTDTVPETATVESNP